MNYLISFLEGVITFISPCLLPMLPIYLGYLAGSGVHSTKRSLINACGFVAGFTIMFVALGALAGTLGSFLQQYQGIFNLICGLIVIFFGLSFLEVIHLPFFKGMKQSGQLQKGGFISAVLFGLVFSVSWTPCVGAFLGSALLLASQQGETLVGIGMLFAYSLGLGIPFILSSLIIERLKTTLQFIKKHYKLINRLSGGFLIIIGVLMATGMLGNWLSLFN